MQVAWIQWGGTATAAVLALLLGEPLRAADQSGVRPVAEELGQRAANTAPQSEQKGGMSDSGVRVLMTYAFSVIPDTQTDEKGNVTKIDKSDPKLFIIPADDARRVIRAATRSAYAEACQLLELAQANYKAMMKTEMAKKTWTEQQLQMINALHKFSASYFAGNAKLTEAPDEAATTGESGGQGAALVTPKPPQCPPEQKQKVESAIKAYIQAAELPASQAAPTP
jgi:hypothetical protein